MKKFSFLKKIIFLTVLIFSPALNFAAETKNTTPEPYNLEEFPQVLKDLRRFEIITLGSMPFITLDVTLGFNGYKSLTEGTAFNPFSKSTFTQDEQFKIILTSLGVSTGLGIFDYVYHVIKRNPKKNKKTETSYINIIPIAEDPDAIKIELNSQENK